MLPTASLAFALALGLAQVAPMQFRPLPRK